MPILLRPPEVLEEIENGKRLIRERLDLLTTRDNSIDANEIDRLLDAMNTEDVNQLIIISLENSGKMPEDKEITFVEPMESHV
jgi:hypothetical protein